MIRTLKFSFLASVAFTAALLVAWAAMSSSARLPIEWAGAAPTERTVDARFANN